MPIKLKLHALSVHQQRARMRKTLLTVGIRNWEEVLSKHVTPEIGVFESALDLDMDVFSRGFCNYSDAFNDQTFHVGLRNVWVLLFVNENNHPEVKISVNKKWIQKCFSSCSSKRSWMFHASATPKGETNSRPCISTIK